MNIDLKERELRSTFEYILGSISNMKLCYIDFLNLELAEITQPRDISGKRRNQLKTTIDVSHSMITMSSI